DMAFIGGSIRNFGGHNPMEAAAYGAMIVMGPHCHNVKEITEELHAEGALTYICNEDEALRVLEELASDPNTIRTKGERGKGVWHRHRGASERIYKEIFQKMAL
ncbi:MAG: 3-deoxy-D-manno-octulosonic acid transferase, partial [Candidatus Dadabacteria bacterium]